MDTNSLLFTYLNVKRYDEEEGREIAMRHAFLQLPRFTDGHLNWFASRLLILIKQTVNANRKEVCRPFR